MRQRHTRSITVFYIVVRLEISGAGSRAGIGAPTGRLFDMFVVCRFLTAKVSTLGYKYGRVRCVIAHQLIVARTGY